MGSIYDLVVRGGVIVDGTGAESFSGDVAVRDGVIVAVGQVDGRGDEEIDASGLIVTPGFVDVHTHYDGQVTWEHRLAPSSSHGVTTVVMGNCGVGFAPVRGGDHELMIKLMEGVEDIPDVVMAEGVPFNWSSFPEYLDALEKRFCDVDFATQIPHSPLRVFVMGERGARLEPPTESDLKAMRALLLVSSQKCVLSVFPPRGTCSIDSAPARFRPVSLRRSTSFLHSAKACGTRAPAYFNAIRTSTRMPTPMPRCVFSRPSPGTPDGPSTSV